MVKFSVPDHIQQNPNFYSIVWVIAEYMLAKSAASTCRSKRRSQHVQKSSSSDGRMNIWSRRY